MLGGLRLTVRGVWIYGTGTHHRGGRLARGQHCGRRKRRKRCGAAQKKRGEEAACEQDTIMEALSTNRPGIIAARASILHARTALLACSTTAIDGRDLAK